MNEFGNTPITPSLPDAPRPAGWFPVWIKAVTQPKEQTFIDITDHPDAQPKTAYIWMFLAGTLTAIVSGFVQAFTVSKTLGEQGIFEGSNVGVVVGAVCAAPVAGALSVLFFALGVAIIQWIAKLFGGTGTYNKLVYAIAAISVPFTLVSVVLLPLNMIPYVGICTGLLSAGLGIYALFLQITAVKAVNRFGWGQAAGSVLLPGFLILIFCACIVVIGLALLGPMIGDVFKGINQSLQLVP
jgi:hypothetical protein